MGQIVGSVTLCHSYFYFNLIHRKSRKTAKIANIAYRRSYRRSSIVRAKVGLSSKVISIQRVPSAHNKGPRLSRQVDCTWGGEVYTVSRVCTSCTQGLCCTFNVQLEGTYCSTQLLDRKLVLKVFCVLRSMECV